MLCKWNDNVTYYALFTACITACEKVSHHKLAIASMQHREELACNTEAKVRIWRQLVQQKEHTVSLLPV